MGGREGAPLNRTGRHRRASVRSAKTRIGRARKVGKAGRTLAGIFLLLAIGVLSAAGCGDSGPRSAYRASTLTVLHAANGRVYPTFTPAQFLIFLPLLRRDAEGVMEGWLARRWEHSDDYRTWTFHLHPDVTWHDGEPVTAHDVKFSLELISHPDAGAWLAPGSFSIRVIADTTVSVTLLKPVSGFWLDYAAIYPKHRLEGLDPKRFHDWEFWTRPVGNGPYRYVRHVPQTMMEFEANPDYFLGEPGVKRVILQFGAPDINELLSGNVDAIPWIGEADLLKLRGDPRFRTYSKILPAHLGAIIWNHDRPPFDDPRVRRALTMAIDRRAIIRALNFPEETPLFDVMFTEEQFYRGELPPPLPYDPEAARRLLDEAGWRDADGGGIRRRGGRPFRFEAAMSDAQSFDRAAVLIQSALRAVGVRMDIARLDAGVVSSRRRAGDFDAVFGEPWPDEDFGVESPIGYRNPRVAPLLERAAATVHPGERDSLHRELWPIFQAEVPVTFLYPVVRSTVAHRRVRGLSSPWHDDPLWYADRLWIEDEEGEGRDPSVSPR